jgi:hypothetical protein
LGLQPFNFNTPYGKELLEATGGSFFHDNTGYYRVLENGEKIKIIDNHNEGEVDYSIGQIKVDKAIEELSNKEIDKD